MTGRRRCDADAGCGARHSRSGQRDGRVRRRGALGSEGQAAGHVADDADHRVLPDARHALPCRRSVAREHGDDRARAPLRISDNGDGRSRCDRIQDAAGRAGAGGEDADVGVSSRRRRCPLCGAAIALPLQRSLWLFLRFLGSAMRLRAQALPLCGAAPTFLCRGKEK